MAIAVVVSFVPVASAHHSAEVPGASLYSDGEACLFKHAVTDDFDLTAFCAKGALESTGTPGDAKVLCVGDTAETHHCDVYFWLTVQVSGPGVCGETTTEQLADKKADACSAPLNNQKKVGPFRKTYDEVPAGGASLQVFGKVCALGSASEEPECVTWPHELIWLDGYDAQASALNLPGYIMDTVDWVVQKAVTSD